MQLQKRRLLRDQRGTAIAETVIMLPAFLLLWSGVLFMFSYSHQILRRGRDMREQTWAYHYAACEGTRPEGMREASASESGGLMGLLAFVTGALLPDRNHVSDEFTREARQPAQRFTGRFVARQRLTWVCNTHPTPVNLIAAVIDAFGG